MSGAQSALSEQTIEKILGLGSNADLGDIVNAFFENLKDEMAKPKTNSSEEQYQETVAYLDATYKLFFDFAMRWAAKTRQEFVDTPNHPKAQDLKQKAANALQALQENMIQYAVHYMNLGYAEGKVLVEIAKYPRPEEAESFKWDSDSGYMLQKNFSERRDLLAKNEALNAGLKILEDNQAQYKAFADNAKKLFGDKAVEDQIRPIRSGLRTGDFAKARKALGKLENEKGKMGAGQDIRDAMMKGGQAYIDAIEAAQDSIRGPDERLYLNTSELSVIIGTHEKEIDQKTKYIRKYQHPFMEGKIAKMHYFREKMLVVGSIESLLTLYMKLIRGLAKPLVEEKEVRKYEGEVLQHVMYLLEGQFQEVYTIEERRQEEMDDFYKTLKEFDSVL